MDTKLGKNYVLSLAPKSVCFPVNNGKFCVAFRSKHLPSYSGYGKTPKQAWQRAAEQLMGILHYQLQN